MTTRSNPELREAAKALLDTLNTGADASYAVRPMRRLDYMRAVEDLRQALAASASGGEEERTAREYYEKLPVVGGGIGPSWDEMPEAKRAWWISAHKLSLSPKPSAPTYNVSRFEFDQLAGEVRVQRAQIDQLIAACRRNGVWVD